MMATTTPVSNGRLGNQKVHTGCKTCKIRKVKCDESKPVCNRCLKGSRECLGYEDLVVSDESCQQLVGGHANLSMPTASISYPIMDTDGLFQFFLETAPNGVSGILDGHFWTELVPQLSSCWSCIRYSLLCLSAFLRRRETQRYMLGKPTAADDVSQHQFAALGSKYYSKAMAAVSQEAVHADNWDVAALTCIIFFCIEALQGTTPGAVSLFRRGLSIVNEARTAHAGGSPLSARLVRSTELIFARICLAITLLHGSTAVAPLLAPALVENDSFLQFTNICAARGALYHLTADTYAFYCHALQHNTYGEDGILNPDALDLQIQLLTRLESWRQRSTSYLSNCATVYERLAQLVFRCHYLLNSIWLKCGLVMSELRFDAYTENFSEIAELCSEIIRLRSTDQNHMSESLFQLEAGALLPLFVAACKCRNVQIRQTALAWLKECPAQEGLWFRDQMFSIATRVVELERLWSDDALLTGEQWRVRHTSFVPLKPGGSNLFPVTFFCQNGWVQSVRCEQLIC